MPSQILNFGLLLLPEHQWLDAAGTVDYLNNHSHAMMKMMRLPQALLDKAPIMNWHYISFDLSPIQTTSGPKQLPSCTYADCPPLDYLVVPGPDPFAPLPEGCSAFLQKRFADPNLKGLLTVCSGSIAIASTGILDGLNVCSNKVALKTCAEAGVLSKKVKWVGDRRWIVDGKVWSAAGVTSGIDLAAEFARVHFDSEIVEITKDVSECSPKPAQPDSFAKILDGVEL
ncbi:ThiJ/PfpI [Crassisporium funariophilum]|nr:ThiJ/PfpI [Crassisporium funariophilum]